METVIVSVDNNALNFSRDITFNNHPITPVGSVLVYAGSVAPSGWLLCDGSAVSRIDYSTLFNVIGTTYGTGNGSTTFNLPNLQDRIPVGKGTTNMNLGITGGQDSVTLTTSELPEHSHSASSTAAGSHSHSVNDPGHQHTYVDAYFAENRGTNDNIYGTSAATDNDNQYQYRSNPKTDSSTTGITINLNGEHNHTITVSNTGTGNAFSIRNKFIVMNYIIRC